MTGYVSADAELLVWTDADWLEEAHAWIHERLDELGRPVTGAIDQLYVRHWATVLRVPTDDGDVYFKATTEAFEAPLSDALGRWRPDCALPVLALDVDRGWLITPDGGTRLRSLGFSPEVVRHWDNVLPVYANLQADLATHSDELLAFGVPDQRLGLLPPMYEDLIEHEPALTTPERERLRMLAPRFAEMCAELDAMDIPATLQHDELHEGHVFVRDRGYAFFDWAEVVVSHPFITLRGTFIALADEYDLAEDDPLLSRWRDVYLDVWTAYGDRDALIRAFGLVQPVGAVCRALRFDAIAKQMRSPFAERYGENPPRILRRFLAVV